MEDPEGSSTRIINESLRNPGDVSRGEFSGEKRTANSHLGFPFVSVSFTVSSTPTFSSVSGCQDFFVQPVTVSVCLSLVCSPTIFSLKLSSSFLGQTTFVLRANYPFLASTLPWALQLSMHGGFCCVLL